jgi:hypothetical protein
MSIQLINAITMEPPPASGTEDSFHPFWDRNVGEILELCNPLGTSIRNSNRHTATKRLRPDYGHLLKLIATFVCIFRGEEKPNMQEGDPKKELADKMTWVYDCAPYILGTVSHWLGCVELTILKGITLWEVTSH